MNKHILLLNAKHWDLLAESEPLLGRLLQVVDLQQTSDNSESILHDQPPLNFHVKLSVTTNSFISWVTQSLGLIQYNWRCIVLFFFILLFIHKCFLCSCLHEIEVMTSHIQDVATTTLSHCTSVDMLRLLTVSVKLVSSVDRPNCCTASTVALACCTASL